MTMPTDQIRNQRGAALILTLMISIAVAAMAMGAIFLSSGATLTTSFGARQVSFQAAADGGLAIIRDSVNRGNFDTMLPLNSYRIIEENAPVKDASGVVIPRVSRSLYIGRTGGRTGGAATAGQYGSNFASAVSIISDDRGAVAARRLLLTQESWSKFAVAIDKWPGSAVYGCDEQVQGPFHSNDALKIQTGCATGSGTLFTGPVSVVGTISGKTSGRFMRGSAEGVKKIEWPTPARVQLMQQFAADADASGGDYDITSPQSTVGATNPALRIEFLTIDLNGNGEIEWDEGFMRVWKASSSSNDSVLKYATARRWENIPSGIPTGSNVNSTRDPNLVSPNCGAEFNPVTADGTDSLRFHTAAQIWARLKANGTNEAGRVDSIRKALTSGTRRCYLGGDPRIHSKATGDTLTPDSLLTMKTASGKMGWWVKKRSGVFPGLSSVRPGDARYLIPLGGNPNFKGVIFVSGDVALSGQLAGRVSVFSTGNIVMADDLLYTNAPGTKCTAEGDIFGAIATVNVVIQDNNLQTPFMVNNKVFGGFDDTPDANYNMFLLATGASPSTAGKGNWYGEGVVGPRAGSNPAFPTWSNTPNASWDVSATNMHGGDASNGFVRVTGGLAQGRLEYATFYSGGTHYGWAEAHSYDPCGAINPPPYFPTTGRFIPNRYYELDPVWLRSVGIADYFTRLRAQ